MINIEQFKRGIKDALAGHPCIYGCHIGMRSTLETDRQSYRDGYAFGLELQWQPAKA